MILLTDTRKAVEDFQEAEISSDDIRKFLDNGELSSDAITLLDKLQGNARVQGEAQYLVITVKP